MDTTREVKVLTRYLGAKQVVPLVVELYQQALDNNRIELSPRDEKFLRIGLRHPFWLGYFDGGLALRNRNCGFRKRIALMLAVMETIPEYAHLFLATEEDMPKVSRILWNGIAGVWKGLWGVVIIAFIR